MIRKRTKLGREWRIAAWCIALGFITQGILALAVAPFLGYTTGVGPLKISGGSPGVFKTIHDDAWYGGSSSIPLIEWPFLSIQIGGFPPDSWSFTNIYVAESIGGTYLGPAQEKEGPQEVVRVPRWSVLSRPGGPKGPAGQRMGWVGELATGWPRPSMYGRVQYSEFPVGADRTTLDGPYYVWSVPIWFTHTFKETGTTIPIFFPNAFVPLRPIPLGTALNSIFYGLLYYATIWFIIRPIWRLLSGARKRERFARGECMWCAYPLGAKNRCPECGRRQRI